MLAAMLSRDLTIGSRTAAFTVAATAHAGLLAAFLLLWGGGVPMLPGDNVYEQQRLVQSVLLACLLPWAAVRCGPCDRGNELTMLSFVGAIPPSRVVMMQFVGLFALLAAIALSGLPLTLVARQMSAVPLQQSLADTLAALALAAVAAAFALAWTQASADRLVAWIGATTATAGIAATAAMLLPRGWAPLVVFVAGLLVVMGCAARANASVLYLSEKPA